MAAASQFRVFDVSTGGPQDAAHAVCCVCARGRDACGPSDLANLPHPDPAVVGVEAATQAYLDTVPPEKRARSDAYFEGGYWLFLWRFVWSSLAMLVLLHFGLSARLRDGAARLTHRVFLQPAL